MPLEFDITNILCGIFFGMVGFSAWRYGKQQSSGRHMILGVGLMAYSYFVSNAWLAVGIGVVLTVFLFWP